MIYFPRWYCFAGSSWQQWRLRLSGSGDLLIGRMIRRKWHDGKPIERMEQLRLQSPQRQRFQRTGSAKFTAVFRGLWYVPGIFREFSLISLGFPWGYNRRPLRFPAPFEGQFVNYTWKNMVAETPNRRSAGANIIECRNVRVPRRTKFSPVRNI